MAETKKGVIVDTDNNNINNSHSHSPHYHSPNNYMNDYTKYWFNNAGALSRRSVENVPIFVIILFTAFFFISMIYYFSTVYATAGVVVEKQIVHNRYSNPSFGIKSIDFPQRWTEAESNTVKGISVYLKLVRSTGFGGELGALDFTAITLTAIKNSSTTSLSSDPNNTSFPRELLQHDDPDCELLDKSTSIINQHSFEIFSVRCNTFQYKTYQTIANDTKISLTYSALLAAFPQYLKVFDETAQTLKISSNSEENLIQ